LREKMQARGVWGNDDRIARLKSSLRLDCP